MTVLRHLLENNNSIGVTMRKYNIALLGFGNVGQALARLLLKKASDIQSQYDLTCSVSGIATGHHGSAINPDGIDLHQALSLIEKGGSLDILSKGSPPADVFDFIHRCGADVIFENTPVNSCSLSSVNIALASALPVPQITS